jgi:UrcA family protein
MTLRLVTLAAGLAILGLSASPAVAEDGAWKVGDSYVVRFQHLDLAQAADRQALLIQVERSAKKLCLGQRTRARQQACAASTIEAALSSVPTRVQKAVQTARLERDGLQRAQR